MRYMAENFNRLREVLKDEEYVDYKNRDNALSIYKGELHTGYTHYETLSDYYSCVTGSRFKLGKEGVVKFYDAVAFLHDFGEGIAVIDDTSELIGYNCELDEFVNARPYQLRTIKRILKKGGFKYLIAVDAYNIEKVIKL